MAAFVPDVAFVTTVRPSPNHGERRGGPPDMIVLHYTGMASADEALAKLCDGEPTDGHRVSAHYFIGEDGRLVQCVPEARRAWHAGVSSWEGKHDVNSRSIGIEIANPGHDFGYPDFPEAQIAAVIALCRDILLRHRLRPDRVVAHSDVAPARKRDPGERFPWRLLSDEGIGLWVAPAEITAGPSLQAGDRGAAIAELQANLAAYGYGIEATGRFDSASRDVVAAFQRHFRPALIDGRADSSTVDTLRRLLAARQRMIDNRLGKPPSSQAIP